MNLAYEQYRLGKVEVEYVIKAAEWLIWRKAKEFSCSTPYFFEDYQQEGREAVIRAVRGFKPQYGHNFSTYCGTCIINQMNRFYCRVVKRDRLDLGYDIEQLKHVDNNPLEIDTENILKEMSVNELKHVQRTLYGVSRKEANIPNSTYTFFTQNLREKFKEVR